MSFFSSLFSCCSTGETDEKYMIKTKDGNSQMYNSLQDVDKSIIEDEHTQITKIKTQQGLSNLRGQLESENKNFTDVQFPHNNASIGRSDSGDIKWKRIPELIPSNVTPTIFDDKIQPNDVITGHEGDCYFLSSLAALAQSPETIREIFKNQTYNKQGIYHLNLRNNGVIEEVVIDDYVPVNQTGVPLYCQPNAKTGEFWVVLIEKAIAKIKGSYHELQVGTPSQVFRAVGHAPAQSIVFTNKAEEKERIWSILLENSNKKNPICATTVTKVTANNHLQSSHTYTVLSAVEFHDEHSAERVLKIRNPWKQINYSGKASCEDNTFWNNIHAVNKQQFIAYNNNSAYGIASLHFNDFMANFNQIHLSNVHGGGKYITEKVVFNDGKGKFFDIQIDREGTFTFELNHSKVIHKKIVQKLQEVDHHIPQQHHEPNQIHIGTQEVEQRLSNLNELRNQNSQAFNLGHNNANIAHSLHNEVDPNEQRCGRSTLIIFQKENIQNNFKFVDGTMRYNEQNTTLTEKLAPGSYVIYAKIDKVGNTQTNPQNACLSLYSSNLATIHQAGPLAYPNIFQNAFLHHAEQHKKIEQSQGKVWISWQLLFQKGGYAYFAVGNEKDNNQAVVVNFNPNDFDSLHFYLKNPHKTMKEQVLRVLPGHKQIIVAKVKNDPLITSVKFPPKLDIKLEPLFNSNI